MTAYIYYRGLSEAVIGTVRGLGAVFGISATLVFPWFQRR
jgi:iron-regulated transporter 1